MKKSTLWIRNLILLSFFSLVGFAHAAGDLFTDVGSACDGIKFDMLNPSARAAAKEQCHDENKRSCKTMVGEAHPYLARDMGYSTLAAAGMTFIGWVISSPNYHLHGENLRRNVRTYALLYTGSWGFSFLFTRAVTTDNETEKCTDRKDWPYFVSVPGSGFNGSKSRYIEDPLYHDREKLDDYRLQNQQAEERIRELEKELDQQKSQNQNR